MEVADGVSLPLVEVTVGASDSASADASFRTSVEPNQGAAALQPSQRRKRSRSPRDASCEVVAVRTRIRGKQSPAPTSEAVALPAALVPTDVGAGPDGPWTALPRESFELLPQRQRYMKVCNKFSWLMRSKRRQLVKPGDDALLQQLMKSPASMDANSQADSYCTFQQFLLETQAPLWIQQFVEDHMLAGTVAREGHRWLDSRAVLLTWVGDWGLWRENDTEPRVSVDTDRKSVV